MYSYFITGPVNHSHFLSLSLAGVHAEPSSFGPPTISPSEPPTQLVSMSYFHLHSWLYYYLRSHPDQDFAGFILQGLLDGFHIGYLAASVLSRPSTSNHSSSAANLPVISAYISQEASAGRMVGLLAVQLRQHVYCNPIGLVPKGHNTGKRCMIVDLSQPCGQTVNGGISKPLCSLRYPSIADAIRMLGLNTLLLKVDLKSVYRIVPIHPLDRHLFGLCWEDHVYVDHTLPFGLRSAPILFITVADVVTWT